MPARSAICGRSTERPASVRWRTACVPKRWTTSPGRNTSSAPASRCASQIERDQLTSIILWGPPGVGKTTLARIIARMTKSEFLPFSAVLAGIKEIKAVMADAERLRKLGRRTILFIDEIHRFNKAQQDAFLPYVETRRHYPDRRDHRESVVRSERGAAFALEGLHAAGAHRRRRSWSCCGARCRWSARRRRDEILEQIAAAANGDARAAYNTLEVAAAVRAARSPSRP